MQFAKGFTLIELMVALAVLAIAVATGVPSYTALITTNRISSEVNEFVASLHYARSEAVKRGIGVRACASIDGINCNGANDWTQGWIVRVDDAAGTVLKRSSALRGGDTLIGDGNTGDRILFNPNGFAFGSNGTVALCDADQRTGRAIIVHITGRIRLENDPADCSPGT